MATEKQLKWRIRSRTLFEIKGIASRSNIADSMCLTQKERELNAVERCKYCGKPATHEGLCKKCYNMVNY